MGTSRVTAGSHGMRATLTIEDHDLGYRALVRRLSTEVRDSYAKAGVLGNAKAERKNKDGEAQPIDSVGLAVIHEFGAPAAGIPERSFIRRSFDAHIAGYLELLVKFVRGIYDGKVNPRQALGVLGTRMAADIKGTVTQGPEIPPPNAPATVARKRAKGRWRKGAANDTRTLVDTGRMVDSVTHEVVMGKASTGGQLAKALGIGEKGGTP